MSENRDILLTNERMFTQIVVKILEKDGFSRLWAEEKQPQFQLPDLMMRKGGNTYCAEIKSSRWDICRSRSILSAARKLVTLSKAQGWIPLIVIGGVLTPPLKAELLGLSIRTVVLDVQNLLYMTQSDRELYDELVAYLPYSVANLTPMEPEYLPVPEAYPPYGTDAYVSPYDASKPVEAFSDPWDAPENAEKNLTPGSDGGEANAGSSGRAFISYAHRDGWDFPKVDGNIFPVDGNIFAGGEPAQDYYVVGRPGTGKSASAALFAFELLKKECEDLREEIGTWQGGKQTSSIAYEKLCTRTLMRLFADDLTLWNEQARSNADLYRFDLICKIKRDNHKDFWEMAERYFDSKYIIFEFKNYSGKVTQKEVYTTLRYLYPTALRRVAIILSPNGMDDHADRAIRGALRDEGKLILSLTNAELVHMLQMKEDGEDPADYLSDKLDELLIDLEK